MEYDEDKVDEMVLALLYLTMENHHGMTRAWKGYDWGAMERLHAKGYISDPRNKYKSVEVSEEGKKLAFELFEKHFSRGR
jgi:hypothetical protein